MVHFPLPQSLAPLPDYTGVLDLIIFIKLPYKMILHFHIRATSLKVKITVLKFIKILHIMFHDNLKTVKTDEYLNKIKAGGKQMGTISKVTP